MYGLKITYAQEAILTIHSHIDRAVYITSDAVACLTTISSITGSVAANFKSKLFISNQYITITAISKHFCPGDVWCWFTICGTI